MPNAGLQGLPSPAPGALADSGPPLQAPGGQASHVALGNSFCSFCEDGNHELKLPAPCVPHGLFLHRPVPKAGASRVPGTTWLPRPCHQDPQQVQLTSGRFMRDPELLPEPSLISSHTFNTKGAQRSRVLPWGPSGLQRVLWRRASRPSAGAWGGRLCACVCVCDTLVCTCLRCCCTSSGEADTLPCPTSLWIPSVEFITGDRGRLGASPGRVSTQSLVRGQQGPQRGQRALRVGREHFAAGPLGSTCFKRACLETAKQLPPPGYSCRGW